jgi:hypothetical protein
LKKLEGRKVISFRGMSDKIVFDGEKIESAIKKSKIDSTLYRLRFGHFGTSVVGLLQKRKWMRNL